jgi:hypothetical protein
VQNISLCTAPYFSTSWEGSRSGSTNAAETSGWRERLPHKASTPTELAKEILSYFLRNPHAADSLEGVARWRLMEERVHRQLENTDQALNWLVRRGFLVKVSSEWTESVYQLNDVNRSIAERFVGESTKPASRAAKPRRRSSSK